MFLYIGRCLLYKMKFLISALVSVKILNNGSSANPLLGDGVGWTRVVEERTSMRVGLSSLFKARTASLEKGMATHSSIPAWRIPWTEELGELQSKGSQRVEHD